MLNKASGQASSSEFVDVVFEHIDALYRSALRMMRNKNDAEDLVQETILKAFRFFNTFKPGTNIKAWLFKIMTNLYINLYREKSRHPQEVGFDEVEEQFLYQRLTELRQKGQPNPEQIFFDRLYGDDVRRCLDELPDDFRTVVILAFIEGFSYEEIAEITGVQLGTVKSRLHRGRKFLQKRLWEYAAKTGFIKGHSSL